MTANSEAQHLTLIENSHITLPAGQLPARLGLEIRRELSIQNTKHQDALKYGRSTWNIPKWIEYAHVLPDGSLTVPRGAEGKVREIAVYAGRTCVIQDETLRLDPVSFDSDIQLSDAQEAAVQDVLTSSKGQLVAPPGAGKTNMALEIIARRRQPTLWITHTKELAQQVRDRAVQFLGMDRVEIGMIGDGRRRIGGRLTIATVRTLSRGMESDLIRAFGQVIVDEAHHCPADMTCRVVSRFPAHHLLGLTATPYRRDGLGPAIEFFLGPVTGMIDADDLKERLVKPRVIKRDTDIMVDGGSFTEIVSALVSHPRRNHLIADNVTSAACQGRKCLVLSDRVEHVDCLADMFGSRGVTVSVLHGQKSRGEREAVRASVDSGRVSVVLATCGLVGEGWDCPRLDTLFLATPISYQGRLKQYLGRVSRTAPGKSDAVVIDYTDGNPMLRSQWRKRRETYESMDVSWIPFDIYLQVMAA